MKTLLTHLESELPYEYCSLLTYSSQCTTMRDFMNLDHKSFCSMLDDIEVEDLSRLDAGFAGVAEHVTSHFQYETPCQIVVFTEGRCSASSILESKLPLPFPNTVHVVYVGDKHDIRTTPLKEGVYHHNGLFLPIDVDNGIAAIKPVLDRLLESFFVSFIGSLQFGSLSCNVSIYPPVSSCSHMVHL
jgi:hypothetical protein